MKDAFKYQVEDALRKQSAHHLKPMFTSMFAIPERVYEYDHAFFVVYNTSTGKYEIHSLNHYPETHALTVPYGELDVRALRWLWRNDLRVHGRDVFRRIEQGEERREKSNQRDWKNWVESVAKETQSEFAKDAWLGG